MRALMQTVDKPLLGIVGGALLLVLVALGVALLRPPESYRGEETAEDVAHNYLLALRQEHYERAHSYLSPSLAGYPPDSAAMTVDILDNPWEFDLLADEAITLEVEAVHVQEGEAVISVRKRVYQQGGLFDEGRYDSTFTMHLQQEGGSWKIIEANQYWLRCWEEREGCQP